MATCPSNTTSTTREWLTLPQDLAIDDSFADDLIRQFDKKRTGLHKDLGQQTCSSPSTVSSVSAPSPLPASPPTPPPAPPAPPASTSKQRRSSANDLIKRSSAFFKSTWSRSHENLRRKESAPPPPPPPSTCLPATIAINTTITLPLTHKSSQPSFPPLQPPVISQYPPKPLQYSPVTTDPPRQKTLIHRLSMPALRRHEHADPHHRRKSDSINPLFRKKKSSHP
ncbi:hypothetical protein BC941DRAFT_516878 [Chlamydoabsidia padenii]|nr:hypothetical protein BC941DRAFT_516878 [Chlamydoabsidia padenii]